MYFQKYLETFAKFMPRSRLHVLTPNNAVDINVLLEKESIGGPPMIVLGHPEQFVNNLQIIYTPKDNTCEISLIVASFILPLDSRNTIPTLKRWLIKLPG